MTDVLSPDDRFREVERFVYKLAWGFRRKYGIPFDEAKSEAFVGYMAAVESYDGSTKFITWVGEKVKRYLQTYVRNKACERKAVELDLTRIPDREPPALFDPDELRRQLQPDARELIDLVLDAPVPILATLAELGETPANYRYALRSWLTDCGWAAGRVAQAFSDVKEAL